MRRRRAIVGSAAAAVIAGALIVGAGVRPATTPSTTAATATDERAPWSWSQGAYGDGYGRSGRSGFVPGGGTGSSSDGSSSGTPGPSSSDGTAPSAATTATAAQQVGVVTITSQLGYENATSAGTGMILSADGLVLTNNHVVESATAIQVTVESTGKTYTATVLGTDKKADVALLKLQDASGLTPVTLDTSGVTGGESVTAIGNAEGTGTLVAAPGSVTATDQTMTAATDSAAAETLSGLIQFSASVVSGDSGGPVLDSTGQVVGITTAASTGPGSTVAYAIDIKDAMAIVTQIENGQGSSDVVIGYPAFLGVSIGSQSQLRGGVGDASGSIGTTSGATIAGVIAGTPAAEAGLLAGDTVTKVGGTAITSSDQLSTVLAGYKPGQKVTITWTSASTGTSRTATVTLAKGPVA
ncbi:MAG: hypothetical protein B7X41_08480 [Microbacterium sp. 14-71-5]|nr:MAG: hypothetical protein B7X41_08480 [Microbacterium sp. 14-71-5]